MEEGLFIWFLNGCYLVGGISIGYWFAQWRQTKPKKTGMGRWDYRHGKRPSDDRDGEYYK